MNLDSVRALKLEAREKIIQPLMLRKQSLGVHASEMAANRQPASMALGVSRSSQNEYQLAVRVQHPLLKNSSAVARIRDMAKNEADIQYIGLVRKQQSPLQQKCIPLRIGCSIGHFKITAGTLGAFVADSSGRTMVLSNNHVLANENDATIGDDILQPGRFDGGQEPGDRIGVLSNFIRLDFQNPNRMDCAAALLDAGISADFGNLDSAGRLAGVRSSAIGPRDAVRKMGRTTGLTRGTVTAVELDNVAVGYDNGTAFFDGQIEIQGDGADAFSQGGDSGSLIFDEDNFGAALLFAGSDQGGANNMGVTYATPIQAVLLALNVTVLQ